MNIKDIKQLVEMINESELSEFRMKDAEFEMVIRTKHYQRSKSSEVGGQVYTMPAAPMPQPAAAPVPAAAPNLSETATPDAGSSESAASNENLIEVKSPIVGTFYRSSSPDKPPFVKVGDSIEEGSVVCIVEAMKLFNEIESEVSGKIVKVMVEDASPVEYDQVLFLVEPA